MAEYCDACMGEGMIDGKICGKCKGRGTIGTYRTYLRYPHVISQTYMILT